MSDPEETPEETPEEMPEEESQDAEVMPEPINGGSGVG